MHEKTASLHLIKIASHLDDMGMHTEADDLTDVALRLAQNKYRALGKMLGNLLGKGENYLSHKGVLPKSVQVNKYIQSPEYISQLNSRLDELTDVQKLLKINPTFRRTYTNWTNMSSKLSDELAQVSSRGVDESSKLYNQFLKNNSFVPEPSRKNAYMNWLQQKKNTLDAKIASPPKRYREQALQTIHQDILKQHMDKMTPTMQQDNMSGLKKALPYVALVPAAGHLLGNNNKSVDTAPVSAQNPFIMNDVQPSGSMTTPFD